jgi:hypothetical protein
MRFGATEVLWKGAKEERSSRRQRPATRKHQPKKNHGRAAAKWQP